MVGEKCCYSGLKKTAAKLLFDWVFSSVTGVSASVCLIDIIITRPDTLFAEKFTFLSLQAASPVSISFQYFRESFNNNCFWKGNDVIRSFSLSGG